MKYIKLTQNKRAIVDNIDYDNLSKYKWFYHNRGNVYTGYARKSNGFMHRIIMDCPKGSVIDHVNGNGLDNRRSNLRICTQSENMMNRGVTRKSKSGYKGVFDTRRRGFIAVIKYKGKLIYLGQSRDPKVLSRIYNKKAKELFGKFFCKTKSK